MSGKFKDISDCTVCGGPVNTDTNGEAEEVHTVCIDQPPEEPILDLSAETMTKVCLNRQYNCGHYSYGPPQELPINCPECNMNTV